MTSLPLLTAAAAATEINPWELFLQADIVVKSVMIGLIIASLWCWMIIFSFTLRMGTIRRGTEGFERNFWGASDIDEFHENHGRQNLPIARVLTAGLNEWRRSTSGKSIDREGTRERLGLAMDASIDGEMEKLSNRLNFLATTGAVAPFVGLFGTVWGIMNSFFQIGAQESSSLAVVAPGISEALFATAIGLFAAIPAVIAYNRFSHSVDQLQARLQRFADRFHASLSRELERM